MGEERFAAPEVLFQPHLIDVESPGIAELLFNTIQAADIDTRTEFYKHIVLSGTYIHTHLYVHMFVCVNIYVFVCVRCPRTCAAEVDTKQKYIRNSVYMHVFK